MTNWISVSERLPGYGKKVRVKTKNGNQYTVKLRLAVNSENCYGWVYQFGQVDARVVTHWQPIAEVEDE